MLFPEHLQTHPEALLRHDLPAHDGAHSCET